jgi:hypothetical protein
MAMRLSILFADSILIKCVTIPFLVVFVVAVCTVYVLAVVVSFIVVLL